MKSLARSFRAPAICVLFSLCIVFYNPVSAFAGVPPVTPEELKMTSEPAAPGAAAIILYRQVDRDDNIHIGHEFNFVRIKILTEEGRKYANIEIPSYKDDADLVGIDARTIQPDGSITKFDGKVFVKPIVKGRGLKLRAKTFTLPDVRVGSVIEYSYTETLPEYSLFNSHWILSDELFIKRALFTLKPCLQVYDQQYFVSWLSSHLPDGTVPPKEGPDHIIRMEAANIPAFKVEDHMPPEDEMKSRVDFVYSDERFEENPQKFWNKKGKRWNSSLENFLGKPQAMQGALAEIVSPGDSAEVKLQKIYARVQKIRNTSYEQSKTTQEQKREDKKKIKSVADLWREGYGDGVQLTWLYLALVRAAGIEAYGVWVSDRNNYFFQPAGMQDYKLDANVVLVKLDGKELYFDPGAKFTPYGLLPWSETGVPGLRLDKDGGSWVITTLPPSSASGIERKATLTMSDTGDLEGKVAITFTGLEGADLRRAQRHTDDTERKKTLEDTLKGFIPAASEVELINKPEWTESSVPFVAEFNVKIPGWAAAAGRRALVPVGLFGGQEKRVFAHTERIHPIYFEYPFTRSDDVTIELPAGWRVSNLPQGRREDAPLVGYLMTAEVDKDGKLHLVRKMRVDVLLLEPKFYGAIREYFQLVRMGDESQIVLQPGTAVTSK